MFVPTNSNNQSLEALRDDSPWAADEHRRFLDALEQFGGQAPGVNETWHAIATAVGSRDVAQVVQHARLYFAHLQLVNAQKRREHQLMASVDQRWTPEEDAAFEDLLAAYSASSVCYPWDVMAAHLPGKAPMDLKERYQKLCYDVARIESGQHVTMHLGQFARHPSGFPSSTKAGQGTGAFDASMTTPRVLDCVVTLTPAEEQILVSAMAEVFVPPEAPADLLADIASAVAAFTSSNGRLPPQRVHPLFTKEQALEVLNGLLTARQTDPQTVLETLAERLRLHPHALDVSAGVFFSGNASSAAACEAEAAEPNLHLLATTGLTFGSLLPSPFGSEFAMPFSSEHMQCAATTPRFMSSLGLLMQGPVDSLRLHAFLSGMSGNTNVLLDNCAMHQASHVLAKRGETSISQVAKASKQVCISYGDWSRRTSIKGHASGPAKGFVEALMRRATVIPMDEYRTSITCSCCRQRLKQARLFTKMKRKEDEVDIRQKERLSKKEVKEVVEMARFRNPRLADKKVVLKCARNALRCINIGCKANFWNRGVNAARNMLELLKSGLKGKHGARRLRAFRRGQ
ncbi:hypothetical protein BBJ28_00015494 [Nothophytophthora sp. Chile5]|nr:hypothetical protein BBJ28_00015494 [Nothophytophthora sp. Chile5]